MSRGLLFSILFSGAIFVQYANADCLGQLTAPKTSEAGPATLQFIDYLEELYQDGNLSLPNLSSLASALEEGQPVLSLALTDASSSNGLIHAVLIRQYLEGALDRPKLLQWAKRFMARHSRISNQKQAVGEVTAMPGVDVKMNRVQKGPFLKFDAPEITRDFLMMASPVTQGMWARLMGANPAQFKDGPDTITLTVNKKPLQMQHDYPIESISWWSALEFANRMSQAAGLQPVYDLSAITSWAGTAESGSLSPSIKSKSTMVMKRDRGGFRLPSIDELRFVLTNRGQEVPLSEDTNMADLEKFGWLRTNADLHTHAVRDLLPMLVGGNKFYDLIGNVYEMTETLNPKGTAMSVTPKGSYNTPAVSLFFPPAAGRKDFQDYAMPKRVGTRSPNLGLRLVRTIGDGETRAIVPW